MPQSSANELASPEPPNTLSTTQMSLLPMPTTNHYETHFRSTLNTSIIQSCKPSGKTALIEPTFHPTAQPTELKEFVALQTCQSCPSR